MGFRALRTQLLPQVVAACDWSVDRRKRWMAIAELQPSGTYVIGSVARIRESDALSVDLIRLSQGRGVLVGFDFPLGLPAAYAHAAGISSFRAALGEFGANRWHRFFAPANTPDEICIERPFFPNGRVARGEVSRLLLAQRLGLAEFGQLLRRCDHATGERQAAQALFWTLGGKQVGKAALDGWRSVIMPALRAPAAWRLWPFDGALPALLRGAAGVIAEIYPAQFYARLGLSAPGAALGKRNPLARKAACDRLADWFAGSGIDLSSGVKRMLCEGCGRRADGEDAFDALVGLAGMLDVLRCYDVRFEPIDPTSRRIEGWILGLPEIWPTSASSPKDGHQDTKTPRSVSRKQLPVW